MTDQPRLDNARVADQGHQNRPFAVSYTATKRPIVSGCKDPLCGAVQRKALGLNAMGEIRGPSHTIVRACYIGIERAAQENQ